MQFRQLTEPFLLLGEIENLLRNMIAPRFTLGELSVARDPSGGRREIHAVADLAFGDYVQLLQEPRRWDKLSLAVDRGLFCKGLDRVRQIRNDVMHFDPDGITDEDLQKLRDFANFLKELESITK